MALSADGGDEIFAGYTYYSLFTRYLELINQIPDFFTEPFSRMIGLISKINLINKPELFHKFETVLKVLKLDKDHRSALLYKYMSSLPDYYHNNLFNYNWEFYKSGYDREPLNRLSDLENVLLTDYLNYLPNDILTKVDRATMSVSLEGREPLLDHRIFEFTAMLPLDFKFKNGNGKLVLKDILHDFVPNKIMDRPKSGFSVPLKYWLKNDLSFLLSEYLSIEALEQSCIFNKNFIVQQLELFRQDKLHYFPLIWKLLMFQMWFKQWI